MGVDGSSVTIWHGGKGKAAHDEGKASHGWKKMEEDCFAPGDPGAKRNQPASAGCVSEVFRTTFIFAGVPGEKYYPVVYRC